MLNVAATRSYLSLKVKVQRHKSKWTRAHITIEKKMCIEAGCIAFSFAHYEQLRGLFTLIDDNHQANFSHSPSLSMNDPLRRLDSHSPYQKSYFTITRHVWLVTLFVYTLWLSAASASGFYQRRIDMEQGFTIMCCTGITETSASFSLT